MTGTDESWARLEIGLQQGQRGLPAGSSLARLRARHRGVRNPKNLPPLNINQILAWADVQKAATGDWPNAKSGQVTGTEETWARVNDAMQQGYRGIPGGSSLAKLLAGHRGVRNHKDLRPRAVE